MAQTFSILDQFGRAIQRQPQRRSGFEVSKTTTENQKHWANADNLAPNAQLTPAKRNTIAQRCLYEVQNNTYAAGAVRTLVGDTVGTSPRLQMLEDDDTLNEAVEDLWKLWAAQIDLALKLRITAGMRYITGESFGIFRDSKKLANMDFPVTLDIKLVAPAQVTDGVLAQYFSSSADDGIMTDDEDEVVGYRILSRHPGDLRSINVKPDQFKAANVVHWFVPEQPDQFRGYTPLASALPIFAQLRRFTSATLTSAEVAAMLSGILESDAPMDGEEAVSSEEYFHAIDLVRGTLLTLPSGTRATQFKPEQPTTNYDMFVNAKLREIGRCVNMPYGKIAGDHSDYNYSSGRLDDAAYWNDRAIERQDFQAKVLDRIFVKFLDFARFALPQLAARKGTLWTVKHSWHYDARPSSDPVKDASGDELNLTNGSDTLSAICARDGTTVEDVLKQRRRDLDLFKKYDLAPPPWAAGNVAPVRVAPEQPPQANKKAVTNVA